ncbi:MAG: DUF6114 domain-containing protein [Nocardioides sp.]|uniref:DUF6114 domain-containing protein n=1 Tax=Nocardioides sp. TaxID=35761 RepID=UPI0039E4A6D9
MSRTDPDRPGDEPDPRLSPHVDELFTNEALLASLGRFTRFRRTRPFWGSALLLAGAYFVGRPVIGGGFAFLADMGASALGAAMIALAMAACALVAMFLPAQRHLPAILGAILSVASLPMANLGGWIIGMLLGIVGSSLIFGWAPYTQAQLVEVAERRRLRRARRDAKRVGRAPRAV